MAANEYYGGHAPYNPQDNDDRYWSQTGVVGSGDMSSPGRTPTPGGIGPSSPSPYDTRFSVASDNDYPAGGRLQGGDQYTDDIPLKPNAPPAAGRPEWMDADTQYPPTSPDPHQNVPLHDPLGSSGKKRKGQGFFKKKIPWVVYITSVVQVGVFIAEIVRNGKCGVLWMSVVS